ncbi:MAG: hypothetical protein WKF91_21615 [Segetibacter sp.]
MARKHFELTIPTKPYLKKYLQALYGEPLFFTINNHFGICIAAFLWRPIQFHHRKELLKIRTDKFEDKLTINLPMAFLTARQSGFYISDNHIITLNKLFENRFEEDLWRFCMAMNLRKRETKDAIEDFCYVYKISIDDDITFEALKKKEWRFRKKMEISAPQVSRVFIEHFFSKM